MLKNILTDKEAATLKEKIAASSRIVICAHKSPDGDAMGSTLAWAEYLHTCFGKEAIIAMPDAFPDFLAWMPDNEKILRYDKHQERISQAFKEADLVFCLDLNQPSRLQDMEKELVECKAEKVLIDHHMGPAIDSIVTVSHEEMSSTCELIFHIVWQLGGFDKLDKKFATNLYCGMMTDTGGFTYNSNRPEIFFIICQLLTKNIDKDKIYRNVFNNYSSWAIRLRGYIMSQKLNVFEDLHASYYALSRQDMRDYHFIKGDAEGLVNEPLRIKGMKMSISLREDDRKDNCIWVSLRSVDDFSVNEVAQNFFNGGGHFNASGGHLDCSLAEAEKITRQAIMYYADKLKL